MEQQIKNSCRAIKTHDNFKQGITWYRCNLCGDMFSNMVHFESWDFYYCIPRSCPNCGIKFINGMEDC